MKMSDRSLAHEIEKLAAERDANVAELERFKDDYARMVSEIDFGETHGEPEDVRKESVFDRISRFFSKFV